MNPKSPRLHRTIEGITAFDRLEADKAKYVKTPQVREQRQNPAINATLSPTLLRRSIQSNHNHNPETKHTASCSLSPIIQPRTLQRHVDSEQRTEQMYITSSTTAMSGTPLLQRKALSLKTEHASSATIPSDMSVKLHISEPQSDKTPNVNCTSYTVQKIGEPRQDNKVVPSPRSPVTQPFSMRRVSGKRQHRPDSLIIYRQRRDIVQNEKENNESSGGLVNRLLQNTPLLKRRIPLAQGSSQPCSQESPNSPRAQKKTDESFMCQVPTFGAPQEAVSKEQSSHSPSDVQHFFESCGLEGSLLDLLDNVYQLGGDTTIGSLESVDRISGRSVVLHEEVKEERTPVSVIERNARVIKWIYSCHNARSINFHRENNKSRESTV